VTVSVGLLALVLAAAGGVIACNNRTIASRSPSPQPAPSVSVLPGLSAADLENDPRAYHETASRLVNVFIKDGTPGPKKQAMAQRIAAMPEVVAYHYVTKREALKRFAKRFGERIVANLPINPLPASFEILVRDRALAVTVARRFFNDPIVDNDPHTHNGVQYSASELPAEGLPLP